jgi:hypothetical protein
MIKQSKILSLPENIEAPLLRYMKVEKLESLLKESALYFRRADLFEDPLEGKQSASTIKDQPSFFAGATPPWLNDSMPLVDARTRKRVFVNCWHNNNTESVSMWDKYTKENKGVAIKSSLNRIRNAILDTETEFLVYPVNYINFEKDHTSDTNSFFTFFHKEISYKKEREVRFAFIQNFERIDSPDFDSLPLEEGIFIPVNNDLLIENIFLGPNTNDEDKNKIYQLLDENKLGDKLQQSAS